MAKKRMVIQLIDEQTKQDIRVCSVIYAQLSGSFPPRVPQMVKYAFQFYRGYLEHEMAVRQAAEPAGPQESAHEAVESTMAADHGD